MATSIRPATASDAPAIRALLGAAFPEEPLAPVVEALRADPRAEAVELVAEAESLLGHVMFTRVALEGAGEVRASILAPLCAAPQHQHEGVGSALVGEGLALLRARGDELCLVFGDPAYYGRFGFRADNARHIATPHPVRPEHEGGWQALWLAPAQPIQATAMPAEALRSPELW
jgi:putative acetyltransferase